MASEKGNLVLSRRVNQEIVIDGPCVLKVVKIHGGNVRLKITADKSVKIIRGELSRHDSKGIGSEIDCMEAGQPSG